MGYRKISEMPRAGRTFWTPETGGRTRQYIGHWIPKYSFSPFTAKARIRYAFYADVLMLQEVESPPGSGKKTRSLTIHLMDGTYLAFRDYTLSSEAMSRISEIVEVYGGESVTSVGYWRSKELVVTPREEE